MRTIPFRDVLHGVAYKFSLDPDQSNFLTNQAIPIGTYIDEWTRRLYDSRDWPEWTVTHKFQPSNHLVAWDARAVDLNVPDVNVGTIVGLGRVIKVFLIDPATTNAPVDTPFTLTDNGIHVGYQHGTYVWIRYMSPPPRFTAVQWAAGTTYQKDDVAYSYTTGEVYRSKVANNLGHDPTSNFALPPHPVVTPPPLPPPQTEVTQEFTPDNVGIQTQNRILRIYFAEVSPPTSGLSDPPPNMSDFGVDIVDENGVSVASASDAGNGVKTISQIMDNIRADLLLDPDMATFTITNNGANKTMDIEDASNFTTVSTGTAYIDPPPNNLITHVFRTALIQAYIPSLAASYGAPQISQTTITADTTYPGAVYELAITDSAGVEHSVEYESQLYDDSAQIINGIILAVQAETTDPFWQGVQLSFDPTGITLDVSVRDRVSVELRPAPTGSGWWELVPFPKAIADAVMRGATADLMREWGQEDKAQAEEQVVPQESDISSNDFTTMPTPPLTGQQAPLSRYRVQ
jgi:hypothetical protein